MESKFAVIDVETTGLNGAVNEIIQFAGILLDENFNPVKEISLYAHPSDMSKVEPEAIAINGYTEQAWNAKGALDQKGLLAGIRGFFSGCKRLMAIGHNVKFDLNFLENTYKRGGISKEFNNLFSYHSLDTVSIALFADLISSNKKAESYKLTETVERFGIPLLAAHDASADAKACLDLLRHYVVNFRNGTPLPGPLQQSRMLSKVAGSTEWMFDRGKHKGKLATQVPQDYIVWMLGEITELSDEQREYLAGIVKFGEVRGIREG